MARRWWRLALLVMGLAGAGAAHAGKASARLGEARAATRRLELEQALQLARAGLEAGDATAEETWSLHALVGEVSAAIGYREAAVEAFSRALVLNPAYQLSPEASPKLMEPYQAAKAALAGGRLEAAPHAVTGEDRWVRLTVRIDGDVLSLVTGGKAWVGPDGAVVPLARTDGLAGQWRCDRAPCAYSLALLDRKGNELLRAGSALAPLYAAEPALPAVAVAPVPVDAQRRWYLRPAPYLATAAAFALAGAYFAGSFADQQARLAALNAQRTDHLYSEALELDAGRRRDQVLMFASFGCAAAAGLGAVVVW